MSVLLVPSGDAGPSLGDLVADWMEASLVHGPGDLRGQPYRLDDEKRAILWRCYEVWPPDHPEAGRRRFRRAAISLRKGSAKTELGAAIAAAELAPDAPVRFTGWERVKGAPVPVGGPVTNPYIPMLAYTEEQSSDLAYAALVVMLSEGPLADLFDFTLERVMRRTGDGKALALANAPDARDGALTTFELFDETHRLTLPRQREAHRTMLANLPKRKLADPWALEVTTAPAPGEGSVAEQTMEYARQVADGTIADARLFFFHRQASETHDLTTPEGVRAAVIEASGPTASWSDIDGIAGQWNDPTADRTYLARVWLNQLVKPSQAAFDAVRFGELKRAAYLPAEGAAITLGLDGSKSGDWTALVGTEVATGFQWPIGIWDPKDFGGEIPRTMVDAAVDEAMTTWSVARFYCDPPYWREELAAWSGRYGEDVVMPWETYRSRPMGSAVRDYEVAIASGALSWGGTDPRFAASLGNCHRRDLAVRDDKGARLWTVGKERGDSPHKIDPTVAAILSWQARMGCIAAGALVVAEPVTVEFIPFE